MAFVSATSVVPTVSVSGRTYNLTVPAPATITVGNQLIVYLYLTTTSLGTVTWSASGWTFQTIVPTSGGGNLIVGTKTADTLDTTATEYFFSGASSVFAGWVPAAAMLNYDGPVAFTTTPSSAAITTSTKAFTAPSVSPTGAANLLIGCFGSMYGAPLTTVPDGMVSRAYARVSGRAAIIVTEQTLSAAGDTGTRTQTVQDNATGVASLVTISPVPAPQIPEFSGTTNLSGSGTLSLSGIGNDPVVTGGTLLTLDAQNGVNGAALTPAGVPTQSVTTNTAGSGATATYYAQPSGPMEGVKFFRFNAPNGANAQMRTAITNSKIQSFRGVYEVLPVTNNVVIAAGRYASGNAWRLQQAANNTIVLQSAQTTTYAVLWTSPVLTQGGFYEIAIDLNAGNTPTDGAIRINVCPQGTNTPIANGSFSTTSANLGAAVITHHDTGATDQNATLGARDVRWTYLRWQNDRTLVGGIPASLPVYTTVTPPGEQTLSGAITLTGSGTLSLSGVSTGGEAPVTGGVLTTRDAQKAPQDSATVPTNGLALSATNIPSQSVTGTNGSYFQDPDEQFWYRQNLTSGTGQYRLAVTNSKTQSFQGNLWIPTPTTFSLGRVILMGRHIGGPSFRASITTSRQIEMQVPGGEFLSLGVTSIAGGLSPSLKYRLTLDYVVGTTPASGSYTSATGDSKFVLKVHLMGSNVPLAGGTITNNTANMGNAAITHYDIGSNDTAAQAIDLRWNGLQFQPDRTLSGQVPTTFSVYVFGGGEPSPPTIPDQDFDIVVGFIQSNMRGRASDFDYPATDFYRDDVYQWEHDTNEVIDAIEPAPVFENTPYMGPLNRFSRSYVDGGSLANGRHLLIVNLAEGGTGVTLPDSNGSNETWWPNETAAKTDLYARAINELNTVFSTVGTNSKVVAVLANHGSTDGTNGTTAATFKSRVTDVINGVRTHIVNNGMADSIVPYIFMQMRPSLLSENRHNILDIAQRELADSLPNVRYAYAPVGSQYAEADSVHFNAAGVRIIGENLYAAYVAPDPDVFSGSVSLSGSGSLSASGSPTPRNTVALTGSGSLAGSGAFGVTRSVALSGSGTLTGSGVSKQIAVGSVGLTGSGTLVAAHKPGFARSVEFSGSGSLSFSALVSVYYDVYKDTYGTSPDRYDDIYDDFYGGADIYSDSYGELPGDEYTSGMHLSGSGSLSFASKISASQPVALSGSGTLSLISKPAVARTVALSGLGTLSAIANFGAAQPVALSGFGTLAFGNSGVAVARAVSLSGSGTLTTFAQTSQPGAASFTGSGTLTLSQRITTYGLTSLSGSGNLSVVEKTQIARTLVLSGSGNLAGSGRSTVSQTLNLTGSGILSTNGSSQFDLSGVASLSGSGSLTTSGRIGPKASLNLTGSGSLFVASQRPSTSSTVALGGTGSLVASATVRTPGNASLSGSGELSATGFSVAASTIAFNGSGSLTTSGKTALRGSVALSGSGQVSFVGGRSVAGNVSLSGSGALSAAGKFGAKRNINLSGSGQLGFSAIMSKTASLSLSGAGTLIAESTHTTQLGSVNLFGNGVLTTQASPGMFRTVQLSGSGLLNAQSTANPGNTVFLTGSGTLQSSGYPGANQIAEFTGSGELAGLYTLSTSRVVFLSGSGFLEFARLIDHYWSIWDGSTEKMLEEVGLWTGTHLKQVSL